MITSKDQEQLFTILANIINRDLTCYAFGGTAMMFYGFKDETKDVDLLFEQEKERQEFIRALHLLNYTERSLGGIYIPEKLRDPHAPRMYQRENSRFDLFVKKIFKTVLSPRMKDDFYAIHEFKSRHTLKVIVFRTEHIVLLKAITERQNDFDDIKLIVQKDSHFDWQYLTDEVLWQYQHGDSWVLLDTEKMLQELKKYVFIEEKYLKQLYAAQSGESQRTAKPPKKKKTTKSL